MALSKTDLAPVLGGIVFDKGPHTYTAPDGHTLIGITTLMKKYGLGANYSAVSEETLNRRAAEGTSVHEALQLFDEGLPVVETPELAAYKTAMREAGLSVVASEYLVSDGERVASSIDKVLDDCSLADVKNTSTFHKEAVSWQLSIYAYLFEKQNPDKKVPHLYGIHVRANACRIHEVRRHSDAEVSRLLMAYAADLPFIPDDAGLPARIEATVARMAERAQVIAALEAKLKELKAEGDGDNETLMDYMSQPEAPKTLEAPDGSKFTYIEPTTRESLDSAWFKNNAPDLYNAHLKRSAVKASIRYTPKKG